MRSFYDETDSRSTNSGSKMNGLNSHRDSYLAQIEIPAFAREPMRQTWLLRPPQGSCSETVLALGTIGGHGLMDARTVVGWAVGS
jgi:hypothetical protein